MLQREAIAHVGAGIVAVEVGDHARLDLQLGVLHVIDLLILDILVLEVDTGRRGGRDDVGVQGEGHDRDHRRRDAVGQHQPPEAHATGQHRDDLRPIRQFGGEEDHGDKGEERAEQVGVIGDEVEIIIHDDRLQGHVGIEKLVDLLVDVEHHRDRDDQGNREDVGPQELLDDIPVYPFQFEIHLLLPLIGLQAVCHLAHHAAFPTTEISGEDVLSRLAHQPEVERQIMDRGDL